MNDTPPASGTSPAIGTGIGIGEGRVRDILARIRPPGSDRDIVALGMIAGINIRDGAVTCVVEVQDKANYSAIEAQIVEALEKDTSIRSARVVLTSSRTKTAERRPTPPDPKPVPGVARILAVASGKGGVGKSTLAVNLAVTWAANGARVGLLDTDIYGPSVPTMLGLQGKPKLDADKRMIPAQKWGLKVMSMGLLIDADAPAVWRGPMLTRAVEQMLRLTSWGELDVLVLDLPPGTGDVALTLARTTSVSGAVLVTTPQGISLIDVEKSLAMFRRVDIPVLGLVENMSRFICPDCGSSHALFPHGGVDKLVKKTKVPKLAEIPHDPRIVQGCDDGTPFMTAADDSPSAQAYQNIAKAIWNNPAFTPPSPSPSPFSPLKK